MGKSLMSLMLASGSFFAFLTYIDLKSYRCFVIGHASTRNENEPKIRGIYLREKTLRWCYAPRTKRCSNRRCPRIYCNGTSGINPRTKTIAIAFPLAISSLHCEAASMVVGCENKKLFQSGWFCYAPRTNRCSNRRCPRIYCNGTSSINLRTKTIAIAFPLAISSLRCEAASMVVGCENKKLFQSGWLCYAPRTKRCSNRRCPRIYCNGTSSINPRTKTIAIAFPLAYEVTFHTEKF